MKAVARWLAAGLVLAAALAVLPGLWAQEKDKNDATRDGADEKPAKLIIKCVEDATIEVEGDKNVKVLTKKTGAERQFTTPPLKLGTKEKPARYSYVVTAKWEPNNYTKITRTRKVIVEPGKTSELDLTKEDPDKPDDIVIRYVPTPEKVVDAMLKLGKVGKDDVVYDLGCGDGRIVVAAVKKFAAKRGVGVDLDPERIKDSRANAREAGVEDKVEFRQGDVMKVKDLDKATVVCLYLADELNEQLRPILQKALKPGSRIVSHRFLMGDWKPEKTETINVSGTPYKIHLWTIKGPAKEEKKDEEKKDNKEKDKKEKEEKARDKKEKGKE
jgi:uncharacterized protein (TIGR03000 family)